MEASVKGASRWVLRGRPKPPRRLDKLVPSHGSHLVAYHIAPVRLSTKALGTFCGLVSASDPQKVPLQRTYSCWKVHSEKRGKGVQTLLNMAGRGQESRSVLLRNCVEGHIYPFLSQMAKVELEEEFSEVHS